MPLGWVRWLVQRQRSKAGKRRVVAYFIVSECDQCHAILARDVLMTLVSSLGSLRKALWLLFQACVLAHY